MAATVPGPTWPGIKFDYSGRRVLVTGGSSGIGLAIASAYAAAGAEVTITGRRESASEYERDLSPFRYLQLDTRDRDGIQAVADAQPALDILVNSAGTAFPDGRDEYEPDAFEDSLRINLSGAFHLACACREKLAQSEMPGGAGILSIASMTSFFGIAMIPGYGASKAGIVQMTKTLAIAWAKEGIRVYAVAAGLTRTNLTTDMMEMPEMLKPHLDRTPAGRVAEPEDIAGAALFLSSAAAAYITGHTLVVDGGFSIAG